MPQMQNQPSEEKTHTWVCLLLPLQLQLLLLICLHRNDLVRSEAVHLSLCEVSRPIFLRKSIAIRNRRRRCGSPPSFLLPFPFKLWRRFSSLPWLSTNPPAVKQQGPAASRSRLSQSVSHVISRYEVIVEKVISNAKPIRRSWRRLTRTSLQH